MQVNLNSLFHARSSPLGSAPIKCERTREFRDWTARRVELQCQNCETSFPNKSRKKPISDHLYVLNYSVLLYMYHNLDHI